MLCAPLVWEGAYAIPLKRSGAIVRSFLECVNIPLFYLRKFENHALLSLLYHLSTVMVSYPFSDHAQIQIVDSLLELSIFLFIFHIFIFTHRLYFYLYFFSIRDEFSIILAYLHFSTVSLQTFFRLSSFSNQHQRLLQNTAKKFL